MKIEVRKICLLITLLSSLAGCATNPNIPTSDYVVYRPGTGYGYNSYNVGYGPGDTDTDFNHDSVVGYGGVNVYDYDAL